MSGASYKILNTQRGWFSAKTTKTVLEMQDRQARLAKLVAISNVASRAMSRGDNDVQDSAKSSSAGRVEEKEDAGTAHLSGKSEVSGSKEISAAISKVVEEAAKAEAMAKQQSESVEKSAAMPEAKHEPKPAPAAGKRDRGFFGRLFGSGENNADAGPKKPAMVHPRAPVPGMGIRDDDL